MLDLAEFISEYSNLWFYEVYDEGNSTQWRNALEYNQPYSSYIPNIYTQDTLNLDTLSLEEVEPSGIFSIQKYYSELDSIQAVTFTMNFALLHTILESEYTGLVGNRNYGTFLDQARCVRAMMDATYQHYPPNQQIVEDNAPEFIMFDYYPFRYVNPDSAMKDSVPDKMCDDDWLFLVDHFEEGIDSTVIPAAVENCPVFFYPQAFGCAGGPHMFDSLGILDYPSYLHRKPAPQEFRMLCNLALLHQAKGIFPYNLCSYTAPPTNENRMMSSLVDRHGIPFDAPYEDWVYTGRWPDSTLEYIRPDSLPPWRSGYDPLYTLPTVPDTSGEGQKKTEIWMEWLFQPYADLYSNTGTILAEVKTIGPEMHDLWWAEGDTCDAASMDWGGGATPRILWSQSSRCSRTMLRKPVIFTTWTGTASQTPIPTRSRSTPGTCRAAPTAAPGCWITPGGSLWKEHGTGTIPSTPSLIPWMPVREDYANWWIPGILSLQT